MRALTAVLLLSFFSLSCGHTASNADFPKVVQEFVYTTLSFSPVFASGQGLHQYNNQNFDTLSNVAGSTGGRRIRNMTMAQEDRPPLAFAEVKEIYVAILAGNAKAAKRACRRHVENAAQVAIDSLVLKLSE